jgi:hypothetical protein
MNARVQLIKAIEQAPDFLIEELLDFLLFAQTRRKQQAEEKAETQPIPSSRTIWEHFEDFTHELPQEVIAQLPTDGAVQVDHYLYGKPKQSPGGITLLNLRDE